MNSGAPTCNFVPSSRMIAQIRSELTNANYMCGDILNAVTVLHTHFFPYSLFPPEKWVYTSFSPGKISIYSFFPPERPVYTHLSPWFLGGKSEYILKFPPHTQFFPFALIDYTRAITPIRGRPFGDFCRAFDAEEGRSPEPPWIRQWLSVNLFLRISTVYSTPRPT